ncbi:MAG: CheR family methyltransferase [Pseudomonadota bacterium]
MADSPALSQIRRSLRLQTGVDTALLPGSLEEAVAMRLEASGVSFEEWMVTFVDQDGPGQRESAELLALLGIGHTHLFRHQAVWDVLVQELAGDGLARVLEVLLLGVSTGEEAYTALMQLGTRLGLENVSALGVDINPRSIARAILGEYPARSAEHVPAWAMDRYLDPRDDGFVVRDAVRQRVRFLSGSLFSVPAAGKFDLVLLRHVLIYFRPPERRRALDRAAGLCRDGGLLVLGATEGGELAGDERFEVVREGLPVFRKVRRGDRPGRTKDTPSTARPAQQPVADSPTVLEDDEVAQLLRPLLEGAPGAALTIDLRRCERVLPGAAWSLGRGLRLLSLRGTVVTVLAPAAEAPRRTLMASLVRELARNGLIRWEVR